MAQRVLRPIEQERGHAAVLNDEEPQPGDEAQGSSLTARLTAEEMKTLLAKREAMMAEGGEGVTDQWRVYQHIIGCIQRGELLRLMVQASAGTGRPVIVAIIILIVIVCLGR